MHIEYKIRLPDHDWAVVADRHKFIPSVYALINIKANAMGQPNAITYSGPTFIVIRSGKHASSSASTHAADFERLAQIPYCKGFILNNAEQMKPVLFILVDGGPNENPTYPKVIQHAIDHLLKYDLDGLSIFTNAPGRSAFNCVERRMASLSRELSGLIFEHSHFGSHLHSSGKTLDEQLEKENFKYAGTVLAEVWSKLIIDNYEFIAENREPNEKIVIPDMPPPKWYSEHVRESQYLVQIVKCTNLSCCKPLRNGIRSILRNGFLVPPYCLMQQSSDIAAPQLSEKTTANDFAPLLLKLVVDVKPKHEGFTVMSYDYFCPSVKKLLKERTCSICGIYFVSKKGTLNITGLHLMGKKHSRAL